MPVFFPPQLAAQMRGLGAQQQPLCPLAVETNETDRGNALHQTRMYASDGAFPQLAALRPAGFSFDPLTPFTSSCDEYFPFCGADCG